MIIHGVDGGTETWGRIDGRYPMCGCAHPQHGVTRHDWMICRACGLPELQAMVSCATARDALE